MENDIEMAKKQLREVEDLLKMLGDSKKVMGQNDEKQIRVKKKEIKKC